MPYILGYQPELLFSGTLTTSGQAIPLGAFPSVEIQIGFGAVGQSVNLDFRTAATGQTQRRYQVLSGFNSAGAWRATIPVAGNELFLDINTGTATVVVTGSWQQRPDLRQDIIDNGGDSSAFQAGSAIFTDSGLTVTNGTTSNFNLNPWFGSVTADIIVTSTATPVATTCRVFWQRQVIGGAVVTIRNEAFAADPPANTFAVTSSMNIAGEGLRLAIQNTLAVSFTSVSIRVVPNNGLGI